jgi:hypothetical protein
MESRPSSRRGSRSKALGLVSKSGLGPPIALVPTKARPTPVLGDAAFEEDFLLAQVDGLALSELRLWAIVDGGLTQRMQFDSESSRSMNNVDYQAEPTKKSSRTSAGTTSLHS